MKTLEDLVNESQAIGKMLSEKGYGWGQISLIGTIIHDGAQSTVDFIQMEDYFLLKEQS